MWVMVALVVASQCLSCSMVWYFDSSSLYGPDEQSIISEVWYNLTAMGEATAVETSASIPLRAMSLEVRENFMSIELGWKCE